MVIVNEALNMKTSLNKWQIMLIRIEKSCDLFMNIIKTELMVCLKQEQINP